MLRKLIIKITAALLVMPFPSVATSQVMYSEDTARTVATLQLLTMVQSARNCFQMVQMTSVAQEEKAKGIPVDVLIKRVRSDLSAETIDAIKLGYQIDSLSGAEVELKYRDCLDRGMQTVMRSSYPPKN
ncbi:hypothetical protein EKL30_17015 [Candidimonas sp. SYP-B2681]|uniref:hypothetical protein n=1 Tax=Candidimonas sp. SYP-B2681 TaxID=2497686 RepID=UPI000F895496|nr:hypothetical protein [Candidimonas sp. SYP-B2681]RTZ39958.1 hypothetical protein EKL30_17015 [Candidimonas sp. SYP-B2681]